MSQWRVRSTTAIRTLCLTLLLLLWGGSAPAADSVDRLLATLAASGAAGSMIDEKVLRQSCGSDALCAAHAVVDGSGGRMRLEANQHPDSDTIRWVKTRPSVRDLGADASGRRHLAIDRFGRTVTREILAALEGSSTDTGANSLVIDLRANGGGDFQRMLRVASLFVGPVGDAVRLATPAGTTALDLPTPKAEIETDRLLVLVGPGTASSGEVLAALLRRHAGARVLGERTAGKDYLVRIFPIDQDWRLLYPAETILVPNESLSGGLRPDGPWSELGQGGQAG